MMNYLQLPRFPVLTAFCLLVGSVVGAPMAGGTAAADEWKDGATEWDACAPGKNVDWRARIVEQKGGTVTWQAQFRNRSDKPMDIHYVYGASNEPRPYKDSVSSVGPGQISPAITFSVTNPANPRQVWMACEGKAPGVAILAASSQPAVQDRFTLEGKEYGYVCSRNQEMIPPGWEKVRGDAPFLSCGFSGGVTVKRQE